MKRLLAPLVHTVIAAAAWGALLPAWALDPPKGKVILTLYGKLGERNRVDTAVFDMAMLEKLPQHSFTTSSPWDALPTKYTGPLLRDILAAAKARGRTVHAQGLNDYRTAIPLDDAYKYPLIVAHHMDDRPIPVRTKGPLFIMYPFDAHAALRSVRYYERSVWQLKSLTVE
ncbi:MAG: molybdopterin-dependent oxidoreductase [Burkholderiaceae bacterium]|nr:molybdopterin-dependent oxidoreductase [Burkholderiaceae bacterium]